MNALLQQAWLRRGALACALWPLSWIYGLLVVFRRALYRVGYFKSLRVRTPGSRRAPVIVVVGNVVVGGAGKTPTVLALLAHLQQRGFQVGVVCRGYGRVRTDCLQVRRHSPAVQVGDEPLLIHRTANVPVFVATQRTTAVRALLRAYPKTQVVLCDDGLQHYALERDINIAVFDERGIGNGWLLPAGPLREPWPRAVDLILHTSSQTDSSIDGFKATRRLADYAVRVDGTQVALSALQHQPLCAVAGIAKPAVFFAMLQERGLLLHSTQALPDHYHFGNYKAPQGNACEIICTEKDAVKLWLGPLSDRVLSVPLVFEPEAEFFSAFDQLLDQAMGPAV